MHKLHPPGKFQTSQVYLESSYPFTVPSFSSLHAVQLTLFPKLPFLTKPTFKLCFCNKSSHQPFLPKLPLPFLPRVVESVYFCLSSLPVSLCKSMKNPKQQTGTNPAELLYTISSNCIFMQAKQHCLKVMLATRANGKSLSKHALEVSLRGKAIVLF